MSIPAIASSIPPSAPPLRLERRSGYRDVTRIVIYGGTIATVMVIASAILLSISLSIGGFGLYCLTALVGISSHYHNFKVLNRDIRQSVNGFDAEVVNMTKIMPALLERMSVLEKEFLNRGRYKYIDETPDGPPSAPSSVSSSAESSPKSSRLSTDSLPK